MKEKMERLLQVSFNAGRIDHGILRGTGGRCRRQPHGRRRQGVRRLPSALCGRGRRSPPPPGRMGRRPYGGTAGGVLHASAVPFGVESVRTASIFTGSSCGLSGRMRACEADEVRQFAPRGDMLGSRPAAYGRRVEPRAGSGGGEWQSAPAVSSPLA